MDLLEELKRQLADLTSKEQKIVSELYDVRFQAKNIRTQIIEKVYDVYPGRLVFDHKNKLHRVVSVKNGDINYKPWVVANPIRKDGTFGTAERNLFGGEWTLAPKQK